MAVAGEALSLWAAAAVEATASWAPAGEAWGCPGWGWEAPKPGCKAAAWLAELLPAAGVL